ncbi:hypothetical protein SAMN04487897_103279 [Paenibacillus sp. yr247]|nr:hypothetical protein SAMN04487897_103279 [Paenibacillus sp. yr247]
MATISHQLTINKGSRGGDYQILFQLYRAVGSRAKKLVYSTVDGGDRSVDLTPAEAGLVSPKGTTTSFVFAETGNQGKITYTLIATVIQNGAADGTSTISLRTPNPVYLIGTLYDENES